MAGWPVLRQLLCALQAHSPLVLGDFLAHGRPLLVADRAVDLRRLQTEDLLGVLGATPTPTLLWCWFCAARCGASAVSPSASPCAISACRWAWRWRSDSRPCSARWSRPSSAELRCSCSARPAARSSFSASSITLVGIVVVAKAGRRKERGAQRAAQKAGVAEFDLQGQLGRDLLGRDVRLLRLGPCCGRADPRADAAAGTGPLWAGPAGALRGVGRRLHDELDLVRGS